MEEHYIYLNNEDKTKLFKLANSKMLSVSTCASIIIDHCNLILTKDQREKYIIKGLNRIHLKTNLKNQKDIICTNCIYLYFHQKELDQRLNIKKLNSMIQRKMDTTTDPTYMKYQILKIQYSINKGKNKK